MKKIYLFVLLCMATMISKSQNDLDALLAAGVDDAQRFANDYLAPGTNGLMYSMNANWFNTADAKPLGGFEISIIANAAVIKDDNKMFLINTADYQNVKFENETGTSAKMVASVLGDNDPSIFVDVEYEDPLGITRTTTIELPTGIGSENINLLPTAYIQGALGFSKGIELKARFVPKVSTDDGDLSMYGAGLQFEMTKWLPADKVLPVAISGLVAYTHLSGNYDLSTASILDGENQRLENNTNTWLFQLIASTKLPVINFYGGVGYIKGKSESDLLGTYRGTSGIFYEEVTDPFSVSSEVSGVRGTIGTKLKLGFFRLNAEYHVAEFDAFSVGLNFGFR
ncbi:hypothetical protein EV196_103413 [Mariniflexile fucanivorans]|uniref:Outer membrane beta-barrel porin/alpha-amylase n=1 Tax=Mariniflexile fucanivorans TaxID=264023 RepID=A0A4R1RL99_9FLAO|nr:DUF6588 family protein [Mariniflexile fucanivorans]TCL66991.1 hypothetical protein EV196_103413 [Mariniflexile fucanivorans]